MKFEYFIKIKILIIIILHLFINKSFATNIGLNCATLVAQLGGLNKVGILWIESLNEKKYQYALINLKNNVNKKFYLCGNKHNINLSSDNTMTVLSERNLEKISSNSIDIFTEIFSVASKDSRKYIMQRLNLDDFKITRSQLNQAYIEGLMALNNRLENLDQKEEEKIIKKEVKNQNTKSKEKEKQQEVKIEISKDKTPPKIIIPNNLTFNTASYKLEGKVEDEGSKIIYVEIDGIIQNAKNGKFVFERFSPVDETVKIIAIDQWGNRSKEKIVKIKIETSEKSVVKKLEKLNPKGKKFNNLTSDKIAIIIGIEKYEKAPLATFAAADAKFFHEYARLVFGVPKENIKLLIDEKASRIDTLAVLNKWLPAKINKNKTELIIFFAGHGLANTKGNINDLYILSQNSDPDMLAESAISRSKFFKKILDLEPKNITMFIDACYSGVSRDEKTLLASARPLRLNSDEQNRIPENFTIFSASQLDQISSGLKEAKHGIFSYYLMKGLEGKADINQDKKITNGELLTYMNQNVSLKAAELGREQNPTLAGDPDKVLISYR